MCMHMCVSVCSFPHSCVTVNYTGQALVAGGYSSRQDPPPSPRQLALLPMQRRRPNPLWNCSDSSISSDARSQLPPHMTRAPGPPRASGSADSRPPSAAIPHHPTPHHPIPFHPSPLHPIPLHPIPPGRMHHLRLGISPTCPPHHHTALSLTWSVPRAPGIPYRASLQAGSCESRSDRTGSQRLGCHPARDTGLWGNGIGIRAAETVCEC